MSHWAVMGGEFVVMGGLWQKYWYHCYKRDFKAGTGCRGLWCVSLVFADQETRRWPPCLHWECFGISGYMEQEEQQSCEESEAGLVSEAAEHWPHSPLCQSLALLH